MKLEISKRARSHIEKRQAWWSEHRPAARSLFLDELAAAERQLRHAPELGASYVECNGRIIRRVLLPKTGTHVYYAPVASSARHAAKSRGGSSIGELRAEVADELLSEFADRDRILQVLEKLIRERNRR